MPVTVEFVVDVPEVVSVVVELVFSVSFVLELVLEFVLELEFELELSPPLEPVVPPLVPEEELEPLHVPAIVSAKVHEEEVFVVSVVPLTVLAE